MKWIKITRNILLCSTALFAQENLSTYANYDFVPGDKVLFEDNFLNSTKGEFPNHWILQAGQALVTDKNGISYMAITEGSYGQVAPAMKSENYLGDVFTIEFDYYYDDMRFPIVQIFDSQGEIHELHFSHQVKTGYFQNDLTGTVAFNDGSFGTKHHGALIYKNGQIKCYIDELRSLVVPSCGFKPEHLSFAGMGGEGFATFFTNVRIAEGGMMNLWEKLSRDGKIISYGIYFDVNKAILKPQSMGTLNEVVKMMKAHPELKLEIGGHTDSDGDDAANQILSQKRADTVKEQLIKMGIPANQLSSKGYGETKPVGDNTTPNGKASNRRVEFIKS